MFYKEIFTYMYTVTVLSNVLIYLLLGTVVATSVLTGSVVTKFYADAQASAVSSPELGSNTTMMSNDSGAAQPATVSFYEPPIPAEMRIGIAATVCFIAGITQVWYFAIANI